MRDAPSQWLRLKRRIFPRKYAWFAGGHLPGARSGKRFGMKSNTAVTDAVRINDGNSAVALAIRKNSKQINIHLHGKKEQLKRKLQQTT